LLTHFRMPGDVEVELYQAKYKKGARSKSLRPHATQKRRTKDRSKIVKAGGPGEI
jgi:hypothetical protein